MTLREAITQELLQAANNPAELPAVFQRYGHSKGPLYLALAEATSQLHEQLRILGQERAQEEERCTHLRGEVEYLDKKRGELDSRVQTLNREAAQVEKKLGSARKVVDEAQELAKLGFSVEQLACLREVLARLAVLQGTKSQKATELFFEAVSHYEQFVALEAEVKQLELARDKAKVEVGRWQAEAKAAEAKCKARRVSVDFTEKLLSHGVKEADLPQWTRILAKARVTPESFAHVLERYSSLEAMVGDRQKRAQELDAQVAKLQRQVKALTDEREGVHSAIQAVREAALAEVQEASQALVSQLEGLEKKVIEFGALSEKVGGLQAEMALARALRSGDPAFWRAATPQAVLPLLAATLTWAQANGFDPHLEPPEYIQRSTLLSSWNRVAFADLVRWAITGLVAEKWKAPGRGSPS